VSDSLTYIENLKRKFHVDEDFVFSDQTSPKNITPNDFCKRYLIDLNDSGIKLPDLINQAFLTVEEQNILEKFSEPYRQKEWFFGRFLAKVAIFECLARLNLELCDLVRIEIYKHTSKKPNFTILDPILSAMKSLPETTYFSISHKKNLIGSIGSLSLPVGIDIEALRHFSPTFSKKIFQPSDLDEYRSFLEASGYDINEDYLKTGIWCLKEATSKAIGLGLSINFKDLGIKYENGKLFVIYDKNHHKYSADLIKKDSFLVGMVRKTK